eukprot:gene11776-2092_t
MSYGVEIRCIRIRVECVSRLERIRGRCAWKGKQTRSTGRVPSRKEAGKDKTLTSGVLRRSRNDKERGGDSLSLSTLGVTLGAMLRAFSPTWDPLKQKLPASWSSTELSPEHDGVGD